MVVHICNVSTQEAKTGGSKVWDQPEYIVRPCLINQKLKEKRKNFIYYRATKEKVNIFVNHTSAKEIKYF
jgi:hypothetical protein